MENEKDKTPENNNLHDSNEDVNCDENTNINNGQEKKILVTIQEEAIVVELMNQKTKISQIMMK